MQVFDFNLNQFVPTPLGLGMHVNVHDPDQKVVISRVRKLTVRTRTVLSVFKLAKILFKQDVKGYQIVGRPLYFSSAWSAF